MNGGCELMDADWCGTLVQRVRRQGKPKPATPCNHYKNELGTECHLHATFPA
jgi:hypothetical protein